MFFKSYYLGCLAHASYVIGGSNGLAAVIDPRRDIDEYVADADAAGLRIAYVIETHLHADFVSGHIELARRTGASILVGAATSVEFEHRAVRDGDEIVLGDVCLRILETPGHTPEGVSVVVAVAGESAPRMVFTGDTLFIGDVGRPDLAGWRGHSAESMARAMYRSLKDKLLALPDSTEILPAHGAGSACGRAISDDLVSTIGREKAGDPALRPVLDGDEEGFIAALMAGQSPIPSYFPHDVAENRRGPAVMGDIRAAARALAPAEFEALSESGTVALDTRSAADFGAGHVPGALNIGIDGKFAPWVGIILQPSSPIAVIADSGREDETIMRLARIGYDHIVGWLAGGMDAWLEAGGEIRTVAQAEPTRLRKLIDERAFPAVLDVRTEAEWNAGHIAGAVHIPLPELTERSSEAPIGTVYVYCGSGYRSSIACSLLQRLGVSDPINLVGGWAGWAEMRSLAPAEDAVRGAV